MTGIPEAERGKEEEWRDKLSLLCSATQTSNECGEQADNSHGSEVYLIKDSNFQGSRE